MSYFINLTPHELTIHCGGSERLILPPSGTVARVETTVTGADAAECAVQGVPVTEVSYGEVLGLPEAELGKVYIVSGMVEARVARSDVYAPGRLILDESGQPIGCEGIKRTLGQP